MVGMHGGVEANMEDEDKQCETSNNNKTTTNKCKQRS